MSAQHAEQFPGPRQLLDVFPGRTQSSNMGADLADLGLGQRVTVGSGEEARSVSGFSHRMGFSPSKVFD
jgi:hypothetical protein